jgi:recombination protein RecA
MAKELETKVPTKVDLFKNLRELEAKLNIQLKTTTSLVRLGSRVNVPMPSISTKMPTIDFNLIGTGGIPRGRIVEIFGPESSGKTTFTLHLVAQEQQLGGIVAFVDMAHALDPTWAAKLGVNVDELVVSQPDSGEDALDTVEALVESKAVTLIIVDDVSSLVPRAELEGDMGDSHMGLQARLMSQACRKLTPICDKNQVTVLFINQIREKIGVMFGSPETTSGGRALKFYASVRLDVRRKAPIKDGDEIIGHILHFKAVKNKVGVPLRETEVELIYAKGFNTFKNYIEYAISMDVIDQAGSWFKFEGKQLGQGLGAVIDVLKSNKSLTKRIDSAILAEIQRRKENV